MQRYLYIILLILLLPQYATAQPGDTVPAPAVHPIYDLTWRPGLGFIPESEIPADWKFDVDDFLRRYAAGEEPATGTLSAELGYYYCDYVMHLGEEGKQREVERMRAAARKYKSERLTDEIRYLQAYVIYRGVPWSDDIAHARKVADEIEADGKLLLAMRLRFDLLRKANAGFDDLYYQGFRVAGELLDDLERVSDSEFIHKREAYSEMGHLHYTFRDYEKAVPLLRKALDGPPHIPNPSNLRTRNTLAVYYHTIDSLDRAEEYYRSMLASPDTVYARAMFNAIAWTGLGRIAAQRGNCLEALPLYEAALPIAVNTNDHNFAAGILISMGECYLAQGDLRRTRNIIDTTLVWIRNPQKYVSTHRYRSLYPLIGKYHLRQGDIATFERYADSTARAEKHYQEVHNARVILRAQDEIFAAEKLVRDEQISAQRRRLTLSRTVLVLAVIAIILLAVALGIRVVYSRRLADKVRGLMEQLSRNEKASTVGAGLVSAQDAAGQPDEGQTQGLPLHTRITTLMHQQHPYTNPDLTRRDVATLLGTNESYLAKAIKQNTGLTFSEYLYYLRLEHAARLLSSEQNNYTIEVIATESGYRSRKTFHQHFRNRFGCTPDEYRQGGPGELAGEGN